MLSEAPTPRPLPLGHGKRCLPSALDAIAQVFIESVGSGLWWRRCFAKNNVADLRRRPSALLTQSCGEDPGMMSRRSGT
jgi:hypothetical protein